MIDEWLNELADSWKSHDIEHVMRLFTGDVEYWETPFKLIRPDNLRDEWQAVREQRDIDIQTEVVVREDSKYVVRWHLTYQTDRGLSEWAGLYVIRLNINGLCDYFLQVGEARA